jgi:hypothetical protein
MNKQAAKEDLTMLLNLDLDNKADTIERLFCCAILEQGIDVAANILVKYRALRDLVYSTCTAV